MAAHRRGRGRFSSSRRMIRWMAAGLAVTEGLLDVAALRNYHLLPSVRGDLLARLGRSSQARAEFERAARLTSNEAERAHLLARASSS
jgi:predicted RNA polymerase sigma factor